MADFPFTFRDPGTTATKSQSTAKKTTPTTTKTQTAKAPSACPVVFRDPKSSAAPAQAVSKSNTSAKASAVKSVATPKVSLPKAVESALTMVSSRSLPTASATVKSTPKEAAPATKSTAAVGLPTASQFMGVFGSPTQIAGARGEAQRQKSAITPTAITAKERQQLKEYNTARQEYETRQTAKGQGTDYLTKTAIPELDRQIADLDQHISYFTTEMFPGMIGYLDEVKARGGDKEQLEARRAQLAARRNEFDLYAKYEVKRQNPDFAEKSKADPAKMERVQSPKADYRGYQGYTGYKDATYAAVNGVKAAQNHLSSWLGYTYRDIPEHVVSMYNYIHATQGADAANKYLDTVQDREYSTAEAATLGVAKGTGLIGLVDILSGGDTAEENARRVAGAQQDHHFAFGAGNVAGGVGSTLLIGKLVGKLPAVSAMGDGAKAATTSAFAMGGNTALQNASPLMAGDMSRKDYLLSVAGSAAGGAVGGLAAKGTTDLGTKALFKTGLQNNIFANAINQGVGGAAFSAANAGTRAVIDPNYNPSAGELAQDAAISFAFQTITSAARLSAQTKQAKAALESEAAALERDLYTLKAMQENGYITDTDFIDGMKARSALLRNTLNTTQYIGHGKDVAGALEFLDQLDDFIGAAEVYNNSRMLPGGFEPSAGSSAGGTGPVIGGVPVPDWVTLPTATGRPSAGLGTLPGVSVPPIAGGGENGLKTAIGSGGALPMAESGTTDQLPTASALAQAQKPASTGETGVMAQPMSQLGTPTATGKEPTARTLPTVKTEAEIVQLPTAEQTVARSAPVAEKIRANIPMVKDMQPVAVVNGGELDGSGSLVERVLGFLSKFGNKATRPGFGDVLFSKSRIKSGFFGHGMGAAKVDAFAAVPYVIEHGIQVDFQENWEGRGYDSYIFQAPIAYKGARTYLGVVVTKDARDSRYYVHEVVDENGGLIYSDKEGSHDAFDGRATLAGTFDTVATRKPSETRIPQPAQGVKPENVTTLPRALELGTLPKGTSDPLDADMGSDEYWDSLYRTQGAPLEPLSDEWYESLLTTGETGYMPKEERSATDIAVTQGLEEYQGPPLSPRRPTAEEVEAEKFTQAMDTLSRKVLKDYGSKAEGVTDGLQEIFQLMGAKNGLSAEQLAEKAQGLARHILSQSSVVDNTAYLDSKPVRAIIRDGAIHVPPEVASNFPDFADFRQRHFGSMKLSSTQGREIDSIFRELATLDAGYFNEAEYSNPADQLARIAEYLDTMKPTSSNPYAPVMDEAATYLGQEITDTLQRLDSRRRALRAAASVREAMDAFAASVTTTEPQFVAEVMTELPTAKAPVRERGKALRRSLYRAFVDSGETVTRIGKAVGDKSLYSFYNFARASGSAGQTMLARGGYQADIWGKKVGPSLGDIFAPIREKGDDYYRDFQMYLLHEHNVDRMSRYNPAAIDIAQADFDQFRNAHPDYDRLNDGEIESWAATGDIFAQEYMKLSRELSRVKHTLNKPVFGADVGADESRGEVSRLLRLHPEFKDMAESVYQYSRNLLQYRVDSGMITPEDMEAIMAIYPHYVPVFRITDGDTKAVKQNGIRISKGIGHATGGSADIVPLHVAMARQTMQVVRNGSANRFASRLLDGYYTHRDAVGEDILKVQDAINFVHPDTFDLPDDPTPKMKNAFTVYKGGDALTVTASKGLLTAMEALTGGDKGWASLSIWKPFEKMNTLFKELVTGYNPMFTARNVARDLQEAGLYSRDPILWAKALPRAVREIATNGELWRRYQALGGVYSSVFDYNKGYTEAGEGHSKLRKYTLDKVDLLNEGVEQAPRLAEFIAQLEKNGDTPEGVMDAMYAAANVTTNFGRSGEVTKFLNRTFVPFLNPGVQGLDKMGKTFFGKKSGREWLGLIARCAALGLAPMLINELINHDAPNWDDIRDSDKDTYWLLHIGDGKYLRIPKGRDISVVGMAADRVADLIRGERVDVGGTLKTAADQMAPANPLSNNILAAWMDADLFDPSSPGKTWYGSDIESRRLQGYAPGQRYDEKTDYISKTVGGALNVSPKKLNYLLDQYSGVVGDFTLPLLSPAGDKNPLAPLQKAFVLDSATSNNVSTRFYDTIDQVTYDINGGDASKKLSSKFLSKQSTAVSDLYKKIREIENSDLPNKEKLEQVRDLKIAVTGIQKNALEVLPDFEAAVKKHYTGDDDEELAAAYREANREVFGAEYALQIEGKSVYEKAQKAHELGASYESYYTAYVKMKGRIGTWAKEQALREADIPEAERNAIYTVAMSDNHYTKFKRAGLTADEAAQAAWAMDTLLPSYGRSNVSDAQKWRSVLDCGLSQEKTVGALGAIMDDTQYRKMETAVDCGISPAIYVTFKELMAKESKKNQETVKRVLDGMALDDKQRAVLWQTQDTSWSAGNNPYSRVVGRQVMDIYEGKK